ncbi:MAG: hypothetical protein R2854_22595 [Caldilineaceae bacterium]
MPLRCHRPRPSARRRPAPRRRWETISQPQRVVPRRRPMSNALAIAAVTAVLKDLLNNG